MLYFINKLLKCFSKCGHIVAINFYITNSSNDLKPKVSTQANFYRLRRTKAPVKGHKSQLKSVSLLKSNYSMNNKSSHAGIATLIRFLSQKLRFIFTRVRNVSIYRLQHHTRDYQSTILRTDDLLQNHTVPTLAFTK